MKEIVDFLWNTPAASLFMGLMGIVSVIVAAFLIMIALGIIIVTLYIILMSIFQGLGWLWHKYRGEY